MLASLHYISGIKLLLMNSSLLSFNGSARFGALDINQSVTSCPVLLLVGLLLTLIHTSIYNFLSALGYYAVPVSASCLNATSVNIFKNRIDNYFQGALFILLCMNSR